MSSLKEQKLLKEYIKSIISEDGTYFVGAESPYGMSFGSEDALYKTFIEPWVDVYKTALGKSKEIARRTATLLQISIETVITTIFPFVGANYAKVFEKEKADIEKIKSEYKDVYDRTDAALKSNDAAFLAFMAFPEYVVGGFAAKNGAKALSGLLSVFTGGYSDKIFQKSKESLKSAGKWADSDEKPNKKKTKSELRSLSGSVLLEREDSSGGKFDSKKLMLNPKFIDAAFGSPAAQEKKKAAKELYKKTIEDVLSEAEGVIKRMNSVQDAQKLTKGKKVPEIEQILKLPTDERKAAEAKLVSGMRKATKDFFVKNLSDHVKKVLESGVSADSPYVKDYKEAIQKIKSM